MTIALVAASFSIIGIVLGHSLNSGAEYRRWLRQERYSRCAQMLALVEEVRTRKLISKIVEEQAASESFLEQVAKVSKANGVTGSEDDIRRTAAALAVQALAEDDRASGFKRLFLDMERISVACQAIVLISTAPVADAAQRLESVVLRVGRLDVDEADAEYGRARDVLISAARAEIEPVGLLGTMVNRIRRY